MYYVYLHVLDGKVFYVGYSHISKPLNGCAYTHQIKHQRAYIRSCRNKKWKELVGERDIEVVIYKYFDTKEDARLCETEQIIDNNCYANVTSKKPVWQFDLDGNMIKKFATVIIARIKTGINSASIHECASGKRLSAGGYIWSFTKECRLIEDKRPYIIQSTMEGNVVATYRSVKSARHALGRNSDFAINSCIKGTQTHAYGFKWQKKTVLKF